VVLQNPCASPTGVPGSPPESNVPARMPQMQPRKDLTSCYASQYASQRFARSDYLFKFVIVAAKTARTGARPLGKQWKGLYNLRQFRNPAWHFSFQATADQP
jgi:hypothetical protein